MKIELKDYVLIKDSFNTQHVVRVDAIDTFPSKNPFKVYKATVMKSLDKSDLNTGTFTDNDVQLILGKINMKTLDEDYPEIFL